MMRHMTLAVALVALGFLPSGTSQDIPPLPCSGEGNVGDQVGCLLDGCTESSGAGVGHVDIGGTDYQASGSWINGCGMQGHDDQAAGEYTGDAAGEWYVNENGYDTDGQRITTCQATSTFLRSAGSVSPAEPIGSESFAATGFCGPSFDAEYADWSFDLHKPETA